MGVPLWDSPSPPPGLCPPWCTGEHRGNVAPDTGEKFSSTGKVPASVYYYYQKPSLQAATSGAAIIPASFFVFFFENA